MRKTRGSKLRAVSIQIRVRVKRPPGVKLTKAFLVDAVRYRNENGEDLPGVQISGVYWQKNGKTYVYEGDRINGALESMFRFMDLESRVFYKVRED